MSEPALMNDDHEATNLNCGENSRRSLGRRGSHCVKHAKTQRTSIFATLIVKQTMILGRAGLWRTQMLMSITGI